MTKYGFLPLIKQYGWFLQVYGRDIVEAHYRACLYAGIRISGTNAEVGQKLASKLYRMMRIEILRWCHLNGSSKLDQLRGLIWEMIFGCQGFSQIINPNDSPKTRPDHLKWFKEKAGLLSISVKVHSAKGGGRLWSGRHFWSKGQEQL